MDPHVDETVQPYTYAGDDPVNADDPTGLSGNPVDVICSGGGTIPSGFTRAEECAAAQHTAEGVTQFELSYQGNPKPVHGPIGTIGICLNLSAGWGIFGTASGCIALVGGRPTLIGTAGGGGGSPTGSLTLGLLISNANRPTDLRGPFGFAGGSADLGLSVGGDGSVGNGSCNQGIWTGEGNVGIGLDLPIPFETHGGATYTWTWTP